MEKAKTFKEERGATEKGVLIRLIILSWKGKCMGYGVSKEKYNGFIPRNLYRLQKTLWRKK